MKIVHVPTEIAGQMQAMVNGLRLAGHESNGFNWFLSYLNYSGEINITDAYELVRIVDPIARYADVIHFHNGNSFLANNIDLPLLYASGKPMVMHHWGNDVRTRKITSLLNPYPIPASYFTDERIHQNLMLTSKYIKHAIVQDYELYPHVSDYYEHVHVLPLVCKHEDIPFAYPSKTNTNPLIIHAPTNRDFKGSEHVERAISELKMTKRFEYRAIEKMSHTQAMKTYLTSDIIVDQLLCGTYGMLSVEAMAMGKVVVAFVRNDVRAKFPPELPIVVANPDNISAVLATLIDQPEARHNLGIAGRYYVEKYHSLKSITPKLLDIYNSAKGGE